MIRNENKKTEMRLCTCIIYLKQKEEKLIFIENKLKLLVSCEQYEGLITTDKGSRQNININMWQMPKPVF